MKYIGVATYENKPPVLSSISYRQMISRFFCTGIHTDCETVAVAVAYRYASEDSVKSACER